MTKKTNAYISSPVVPTLLVGIHAPYNSLNDMSYYFEEFLSLAKTNGILPTHTYFIKKLRTIDTRYFITLGKLEEMLAYCKEHNIEHVVISEALTAQQERNLSNFLNCTITDRTKLILEIFEKAALSAEGKAQVAMAMLKYKKSRLAGKGIHMGQQQGGAGFMAGAGETAKERETRHIDQAILRIQRQLAHIAKTRDTQRKQRLSNNIPLICLVGYTNSGKSTLLNQLTNSTVLAQDKLFATLDTTTRELYINGLKKGLLSDTVGFIQQLPHGLVEAFKSTLKELEYANLLLHVIDISDPNWRTHIQVTQTTLQELGVTSPMVYVFNKIDRVTLDEQEKLLLEQYQPHVFVSALTKEGIEPLQELLHSWTLSL